MHRSNLDDQQSKEKSSRSSKDDIKTRMVSSNDIHPRQRIVQNFRLIWVDEKINLEKEEYQNTLIELRNIVNDVNVLTETDQCIRFVKTIDKEKVFVITSISLGEHLVPHIHDMPQLNSIYILCENKCEDEGWTRKWNKIEGIHKHVKTLCQALQLHTKQCDQDTIPLSFVSVDQGESNQRFDQLEPSFMYTHIFKEIILQMKHDKQSIKDLSIYCRNIYEGNIGQLSIIDEFEDDYRPESSIWWYTRECFTYQMLNRALRTLEGDTIVNMSFFIHDLHRQLEQLHKKEVEKYLGKPFLVYRGQGLSPIAFNKLVKTKGGLLSFNNFLSTSTTREVSLGFARDASTRNDTIGILFQMSIDPSISSSPFASISEVSYFQSEEEILFSMHTVFRIGQIKQIDNNKSFYQVDLKLTDDDDQQLRKLTQRIREETADESGLDRLSVLLVKIGQLDKAEQIFQILLQQTSDQKDKATYYNNLGYINDDQGNYDKAILYYQKCIQIREEILPSDHSDLADSYGNIALVYRNMEEYSKALKFIQKDIQIREKNLPESDSSLATSYHNIGLVYYSLGEYTKSKEFYQKSIQIREEVLPKNHPDFCQSFNSIAAVYYKMGEYSNALTFFERALHIGQSSLPQDHQDIQNAQQNIQFIKNKF